MIARDREPDLRRRYAAVERGLKDVVHGAAQRHGQADRRERVHHRPADRDQERTRVRPDVRHDQTQAAQEQAAFGHLRCLDVGLQELSSVPTRHPRRERLGLRVDARCWNDAAHDPTPALVPQVARRRPANPRTDPRDCRCSGTLQDAAAGFPDKPATAFFGAHLSYRELLDQVERFSAVLAGLGVKQGDRVGLLMPNCPGVPHRLVRVPADGRDRGRQQPAVHTARARTPDQGRRHQSHGRARERLRELREGARCGRHPRGRRGQAHRPHEVPAQHAGADQVPEGRQEGGPPVAADPRRSSGAVVEGRHEVCGSVAAGRGRRPAGRCRLR